MQGKTDRIKYSLDSNRIVYGAKDSRNGFQSDGRDPIDFAVGTQREHRWAHPTHDVAQRDPGDPKSLCNNWYRKIRAGGIAIKKKDRILHSQLNPDQVLQFQKRFQFTLAAISNRILLFQSRSRPFSAIVRNLCGVPRSIISQVQYHMRT